MLHPRGRKMRCNIFLQKRWTYYFSRLSFLQKTPWGLILSAHFPDFRTLLSFFFIFSYPELSKKEIPKLRLMGIIACDNFTQSEGKRWKRQRYGDRNTWTGGILLCAVTEVYRRQRKPVVQNQKSECRLYTGGTWESFGKMGKQVRRKMVYYKTFN